MPAPLRSSRASAPLRSGSSGFTILELGLVVLVVLALTAVVLASTGGIQGRSREIDCHDELRTVKVAVANYHAVEDRDPASTRALLRTKDPVRGGHYLNAQPRWYDVRAGGVIALKPGAPSSCPRP